MDRHLFVQLLSKFHINIFSKKIQLNYFKKIILYQINIFLENIIRFTIFCLFLFISYATYLSLNYFIILSCCSSILLSLFLSSFLCMNPTFVSCEHVLLIYALELHFLVKRLNLDVTSKYCLWKNSYFSLNPEK